MLSAKRGVVTGGSLRLPVRLCNGSRFLRPLRQEYPHLHAYPLRIVPRDLLRAEGALFFVGEAGRFPTPSVFSVRRSVTTIRALRGRFSGGHTTAIVFVDCLKLLHDSIGTSTTLTDPARASYHGVLFLEHVAFPYGTPTPC